MIAMPGEVRCDASQQDTSMGTLDGHSCVVEAGDEPWRRLLLGKLSNLYLLSWFELPSSLGEGDVPDLLTELRDETVELLTEPSASRRARLADGSPLAVQQMSKSIPHGPEPPRPLAKSSEMTKVLVGDVEGVEFETVLTEAKSAAYRLVWRERMFVRGGRLYRMTVSGGDLDASADAGWKRMIETFQFVPETKEPGR